MTQVERDILDELERAGPSRALEIHAAFVGLGFASVGEFCDAISSLARSGLVEVRAIENRPFWAITSAGRDALHAPPKP